jgi:protein-tyrosine phosphatase
MQFNRRQALITGLAVPVTLGTAWAAAPLTADCSRVSADRVKITWSSAGPVNIQTSTQPEGPFRTVVRASGGEWQGIVPASPRRYFRLNGREGRIETAERVLPLQGGRNFRDLGGYRTADGRMVRWGRLYRSGSMTGLTDADYGYLRKLGISVICDFRTTAERAQEPTGWTGQGAPRMLSRDYVQSTDELVRTLIATGPTAEKVRAHMMSIYESMPYEHAGSYRTMFAELVAGRTPLAFNCSGGKDRTGIGAGLLLTALGVPRGQVIEDYALTEKIMDFEAIARNTASVGAPPPAGFDSIAKLSPEVRAPMIRSDPAYLQAAFAAIERREGSVANFLDNRVGVSAADIRGLRQGLLKPV